MLNRDEKLSQLINALNILLNSKALPSRQRRDVAGIARLVADSKIFDVLTEMIEREVLEK